MEWRIEILWLRNGSDFIYTGNSCASMSELPSCAYISVSDILNLLAPELFFF